MRPKRHRACLATFSKEVDDLAVRMRDLQLNDLRDPRAGVIHQGEKNSIALVAPRRVVTDGEDGGDLFAGEEADERLDAAFERDGKEALSNGEVIRSGLGEDKMNEAANRRQPRIAGAHRVFALGFAMIEKSEHHLGGERGQRELINRAPEVVGEKSQEQAEGIAISGDGLRTDIALSDQVVREESLNERGELHRQPCCPRDPLRATGSTDCVTFWLEPDSVFGSSSLTMLACSSLRLGLSVIGPAL